MEALKIYEIDENYILPQNRAFLMNQLSWLFLEKENYNKVIEFGNNALKLEKQFYAPYDRVESFEFLADAYREINEKEKSGMYSEKYKLLKDSLIFAEKKIRILSQRLWFLKSTTTTDVTGWRSLYDQF